MGQVIAPELDVNDFALQSSDLEPTPTWSLIPRTAEPASTGYTVDAAARLIAASNRVVAFTGAGISVESGIPDFRTPGSGLWSDFDPLECATGEAFKKDPLQNWKMNIALEKVVTAAAPNPAHHAICELEKLGLCQTVITQNMDGLHQKAGSSRVLELHGSVTSSKCCKCGKEYDLEQTRNRYRVQMPPTCTESECSGILKANTVLFGEPLPYMTLREARQQAELADVVIVVGCSFAVAPANEIPQLTRAHGGKVILINTTSTLQEDIADVVLVGQAGEILPQIVSAVRALQKAT